MSHPEKKLQFCDKGHMPVSFVSVEQEACPVCEATRIRKLLEQEVEEFCGNAVFWRGIVIKIGDMFGEAARTSDDGSVQDTVVALKVPELVSAALQNLNDLVYRGYDRKHKRMGRVTRVNLRHKRRRSSTGAALILGACAGFIAGIFKRSR